MNETGHGQVCPILSSGAHAGELNPPPRSVRCWFEACMLWDGKVGTCSLSAESRRGDAAEHGIKEM